jgi:hypothetical protein
VPRKPKDQAKVTARMLKIRELIEQGDYPDLDELAEKIVDHAGPTAVIEHVPVGKPRTT